MLNDGAIMMSQETMAEVFGNWWSTVRPSSRSTWRLAPTSTPCASNSITLVGRGEAIDKREFERASGSTGRAKRRSATSPISGFIMGVMIGMVFIYYVQIIRFYLPEYAILKSLGYDWWFFLFMIGQIGAAIITPAFSVAPWRPVCNVTEAAMHLSMGLREMTVALSPA